MLVPATVSDDPERVSDTGTSVPSLPHDGGLPSRFVKQSCLNILWAADSYSLSSVTD